MDTKRSKINQSGEASAAASDAVPSLKTVLSVGAFGVTLLVILRVFALAGWNWESARAILATVDLGEVPKIVLDTIYSEPVASAIIVSVAGPLVAAFAIEIARHRQRASLVQGIIVALFLAAGFSLLFTFHLWWMIGVAVIVSIGVAAGLNPRSPKIVRSIATFAISRAIAACLILELVVAAFSSHPWMEREIIVLSSGERVDCFPLEVQSGYIKVLNTGDREVRILITKDVVSRELSGM